MTEAEQDTRWTEHSSEVLNRPPPPTEADVPEAETDLDVNTDPPRKEEIIAAIKSLENGKSPRHDNLSAEVFKANPQLAADLPQLLFTDIWLRKKLPKDWTEGVTVKIPKKGAFNNCNNCRGITLLPVPSKILAKIIIQQKVDTVNQQLRREQAGFRKGKGCTDQISTLRNIIEQCTEWQRQLCINFVVFEKALTACTGKVCGTSFRPMGYHSRLWTPSKASKTTPHAE